MLDRIIMVLVMLLLLGSIVFFRSILGFFYSFTYEPLVKQTVTEMLDSCK